MVVHLVLKRDLSMTKKATREQTERVPARKARRFVNTPSRSFEGNQMAQTACGTAENSQELGKQVYSSEEQALEVLVDSVVGKLAGSPKEQREMADFLEMILDTDPALRSEILAHTTVRK